MEIAIVRSSRPEICRTQLQQEEVWRVLWGEEAVPILSTPWSCLSEPITPTLKRDTHNLTVTGPHSVDLTEGLKTASVSVRRESELQGYKMPVSIASPCERGRADLSLTRLCQSRQAQVTL